MNSVYIAPYFMIKLPSWNKLCDDLINNVSVFFLSLAF